MRCFALLYDQKGKAIPLFAVGTKGEQCQKKQMNHKSE